MAFVPPARHLLRARDFIDARYPEPIGVAEMAAGAGLSRAHFGREFRRVFGVSPHGYLLTRAAFPPAAATAVIPSCMIRAYGRPQHRTFREDGEPSRA